MALETEGRKLKKMRDAELKRRDKKRLTELRERIKSAHHARRARIHEIRGLCRVGRNNVRQRIVALREETRERLRDQIARIREAEQDRCATSEQKARAELGKHIEVARRELNEERRAFAERYGRKAQKNARRAARERADESFDEVAHNLPPELQAVWKRVAKSIKGGPRRSRTEAFLEWAEENPDEVHGILYAEADRDVARLIREHEEVERRLAKTRGAYDDFEAEARALAGGNDIPF